jgi:hypothetical protein
MTKQIFWLYPERDTASQLQVGENEYWGAYRFGAESAGMQFGGGFSPEAVDIVLRSDTDVNAGVPHSRVYVDGREVTPEQAIFVSDLYLYPYAMQDAWSQLSLSWVLRQLGFYLPIPPELSILVSDKVAALLYASELGLPVLSTSRLTTGRDWDRRNLEILTKGLHFPMAVRPCHWCGGWGFNVARDMNDLSALVSLASGADTILILQPLVDPDRLLDCRVVCIDGEPTMSMMRKPAPGTIVASVTRGASSWLGPVPAQLTEPARQIAADVDVPYLCVDFLMDGERYWFSEMEPDGSITREDWAEDDEARSVLKARFLAFDRGHERWLSRAR